MNFNNSSEGNCRFFDQTCAKTPPGGTKDRIRSQNFFDDIEGHLVALICEEPNFLSYLNSLLYKTKACTILVFKESRKR